MGDASMRSHQDFKTSRSGRILFPRLKGWTGERIVIRKGGGVDLLDGGPDCTSTFESERSLFKARNGITMSQTFNMPTTVSQAQRIKISRSLSQSPSTEASQQRAIKRSKLKENQPVIKPTSSVKKTKRSPSPNKKKLTRKSVSSSQESLERPSPKVLRTRVPCATSADPSKSPEKTSANPPRGAPRERGVPPTTVNNNSRPSRSLVRNSETYVKPGPKCSKPRPPTDSSSSRERRPNPSGKQKHLKRGSPTRSRRQRRNNASPTPQDVDIFGPEFQPVVVLKRLRIRSEAALQMSTKTKINNTARNSKRKSPVLANKVVKKKKKVIASTKSTVRGRARTVKETKAIIEATSKAADAVVEDEAEATAAFFKKDNAAFKRLTEATDILHDDFGESDDNLSIRTMRESSPMPSAVSPIGSLYGDSDADENGDDRLLGGSPTLKDRTSFQKAQLVHRVVKDRAKLMQQKTKKQKRRQMDIGDEEETAFPSGSSNITPRVGELLKPQRMRALERDLKAKVGTRAFDFDTIFNGNLIHISVNSDSESEESSVDSLAD